MVAHFNEWASTCAVQVNKGVTMSKMEMGKKYKTRSGLAVRILCIDRNDTHYPVIGLYTTKAGNEEMFTTTAGGKYFHGGGESSLDLFEVSPYDHIKVDDLVVVRPECCTTWQVRYFAGVDSYGRPKAWSAGATSITATVAIDWDDCELFDATNPAHVNAEKA
jgi:hypothetical protein